MAKASELAERLRKLEVAYGFDDDTPRDAAALLLEQEKKLQDAVQYLERVIAKFETAYEEAAKLRKALETALEAMDNGQTDRAYNTIHVALGEG